jgi:hypothetical protein
MPEVSHMNNFRADTAARRALLRLLPASSDSISKPQMLAVDVSEYLILECFELEGTRI